MDVWFYCRLEVLATGPKETNGVATALCEPSEEFLIRMAGEMAKRDEFIKRKMAEIEKIEREVFGFRARSLVQPRGERFAVDVEVTWLRAHAKFRPTENLDLRCLDVRVKTACEFENTFPASFEDLIHRYLYQISVSFPNAIFLALYHDVQGRRFWKEVIRNGVLEQSVNNQNPHAQVSDWVLLDIFAPFRAEHETGQPFGSLWKEWVDDVVAAASELRTYREVEVEK